MSTVTAIHIAYPSYDPNFPTGFNDVSFGGQAFDFGRNWMYAPGYGSGHYGIWVTDLSTMTIIKSVTLEQLYAGTPFGSPPGFPPEQFLKDVTCGYNTDIYIRMSRDGTFGEFCELVRIDPDTMKVTGTWYISNTFPPPIKCIMGGGGVVNTTVTHTIVAYVTNSGLNYPDGFGAQFFDGTDMQPIGIAPPAFSHPPGNNQGLMAGARYPDGSCDFLQINCDNGGHTGFVDIWRTHITDALVMTTTKTGTVHTADFFLPTNNLYCSQWNYDTTHDCLILQITPGPYPSASPTWMMSVNYDGSVNWARTVTQTPSYYSRGQSLLTGTDMMIGTGYDLEVINTGTGETTFTGTVFDVGSAFYHVYDGSRRQYWTYAIASFGQVRIDFIVGAKLALDNLLVQEKIPEVAALIYRWRSRQFYLPEPASLGACQISLASSVSIPPPLDMPAAALSNADPALTLPPGVNAIFKLFVGPNGENLYMTKILDQPRMIFRLPSGLKAFNWQFEIVARVPIHSVELASTMRELRKV